MSAHTPCPICDAEPTVRAFKVSPLFGGGTGYEVACPECGFSSGVQYFDAEAAWEDWEAYIEEDYLSDWEEET